MIPPPPNLTWQGEEAAALLPLSSYYLIRHPYPVKAIAKEEQGDCMEKLFRKTKGKFFQRRTATRNGAERHGAYLVGG